MSLICIPPAHTPGFRWAASGMIVATIALAATATIATGGPVAERCVAGSVPLVVGRQALLVRKASAGDRAELSACRRGSRGVVRLGATYGDAVRPHAGARSTLTGAAVGGSVVAAGFEVVASGCIYERGCGDVPRQVLRIADTSARTLRRIPLRGTLTALTVAADGSATFRVDEFACTSTYRAAPSPGSDVRLLSRVPTRVPVATGLLLCAEVREPQASDS